MTLTATWIGDHAAGRRLWMASDSRISDADGVLFDAGAKLFELPLVSRSPSSTGFFDRATFATSLGLLCAGSTLIFQHVYATLVPTLGNLIGMDSVPSLQQVADFVGRMTTVYTRALGAHRPRNAVVDLVLGGLDPVTAELQAFELAPERGEEGLVAFFPRAVDLQGGRVRFGGDATAIRAATESLDRVRADPGPGRPFERAALNVIREVSQDDQFPTVGGDVQVGCTIQADFRRFATVTTSGPGSPAQMRLNNIDLHALGGVGPCALGVPGMFSP